MSNKKRIRKFLKKNKSIGLLSSVKIFDHHKYAVDFASNIENQTRWSRIAITEEGFPVFIMKK